MKSANKSCSWNMMITGFRNTFEKKSCKKKKKFKLGAKMPLIHFPGNYHLFSLIKCNISGLICHWAFLYLPPINHVFKPEIGSSHYCSGSRDASRQIYNPQNVCGGLINVARALFGNRWHWHAKPTHWPKVNPEGLLLHRPLLFLPSKGTDAAILGGKCSSWNERGGHQNCCSVSREPWGEDRKDGMALINRPAA